MTSYQWQQLSDYVEQAIFTVQQLAKDKPLQQRLQAIQQWQNQRLMNTYHDVIDTPGYHQALLFFIEDLYGGDRCLQRDEQIYRLLPIITRLLPDNLLYIVESAAELHWLTLKHDMHVTRHFNEIFGAETAITEKNYIEIFRQFDQLEYRLEQLHKVISIGKQLDHHIHHPWLLKAVSLARIPAKLSGFALVQKFVERGIDSFCHLESTEDFLSLIEHRESVLLQRIFNEDTEHLIPDTWPEKPYPED